MTIDEICTEVSQNGYKNLSDSEIDEYVSWKAQLATRDAEFQKRLDTYDAQLKAAAESQRQLAEHAQVRFDALVGNPPNFDVIE